MDRRAPLWRLLGLHCRRLRGFSDSLSSPTVTHVRNDPVNTACRTLIEESMGCEGDQATLQGA